MLFENIDEFINYNNEHLISFTVSTYNNLNMLRNLISSANLNNINLVFFALDKNIATYVNKNFNIDVVLFILDDNLSNNGFMNYKYGSKEWASIVYHRYFITHRLLKDGRNIVYMDTDVFINRNYLVDIKEKLRKNDIVIQSNDRDCCTGFFAMKSTKQLTLFFNRKNMINKLKCYEYGGAGGPSDQKFFNHYIGKHMKDYNCKLLERNFYPNGNYFYDNYDIINEYCYIVHFNCVKGEYKKIKKTIEFNKLLIKLIDYMPNDEHTLEQKDIMEYKNLLDSVNAYDLNDEEDTTIIKIKNEEVNDKDNNEETNNDQVNIEETNNKQVNNEEINNVEVNIEEINNDEVNIEETNNDQVNIEEINNDEVNIEEINNNEELNNDEVSNIDDELNNDEVSNIDDELNNDDKVNNVDDEINNDHDLNENSEDENELHN